MDFSEDDRRMRSSGDSSDVENHPTVDDSDEDQLSQKYQRGRSNNNEGDNSSNTLYEQKKRKRGDVPVARNGKSKLRERTRRGFLDKDKGSGPKDMNRDPAADLTVEENELAAERYLNWESRRSSWKRTQGNKGRKRHHRGRHHRSSNENQGQISILRRLGISEGKDKMVWARRAFFMSTEKIFPGFIRNCEMANSLSRDPNGVKLRTSVPLKVCLLAHAYFLPIWFIAFLMTQSFASRSLKPLHNYVHTCLTYVSMGTDILRLYAGFTSNTRDDMQLLALYWMATAILQTPMMCFIFATHCFSTSLLPLNVSVDILLEAILILEIWFGFWQLKSLVSSEIELLQMAKRMNTISALKSRERHNHPRVVNGPDKEPYIAWSDAVSEVTTSSDIGEEEPVHRSRPPSGKGANKPLSKIKNYNAGKPTNSGNPLDNEKDASITD